jgi:diacylglycerol kinase (ATP)
MTPPNAYLIIYNPTAGRGRGQRVAREVGAMLESAGRDCRLAATTAKGDAKRLAVDAASKAEGTCVVACGGDGTVQEVANGILSAGPDRAILGLAPAGRCNDFARALRIKTNPEAIVKTLTSGTLRRVDLGRIGERYFCTIAALGFDAAVTRYVNDMRAPIRGTLAYIYGTLCVLRRYRTPEVRLEGDFGVYEGPVFFAASGNTACYGGSMRVCPDADPHDGVLDICLVKQIRRLQVLRLLPQAMSGTHVCRPEVQLVRTQRLTATALDGSDVEVWADGERVGTCPVTIECVPDAISVLLPASDTIS